MRVLLLALVIVVASGFPPPVAGQICPLPVVVNNSTCTVNPGTVISVNTAAGFGLNVSGSTGDVTADGVTVNLGATTATACLAQSGAAISFDGSAINTTSVGSAASGQTGLRATGPTSEIGAAGATITMKPASGTTNNMTGVAAADSAVVTLDNVAVQMGGGTNGIGNHGLTAGTSAQVSVTGGSVSTASRAAFGALAQGGGVVTLSGGAQVTTTGAQNPNSAAGTGSHGLIATGAASQVTANGVEVSTSGLGANGARAELGGLVSLVGSVITSSSAAQADTNPSAGVRAVSGGTLQMSGAGSAITASGQRGHGVSVEGAGSQVSVSDTSITVSGDRASGVNVLAGGQATLTASTVIDTAQIGVLVTDAGSTVGLTNTTVKATGPVGYGLRALAGASATMTGGSVTTEGRDAAAIYAASSTVSATNVTVATSGPDSAMGVLADGSSQITLIGGSVTTSGNTVRAGARPHGLAARNPSGVLTATSVAVLTRGEEAFGATADDGGIITLNDVAIRAENRLGLGLFSVSEQAGPQFPASITATDLTVETLGLNGYGAAAQARNDIQADLAAITITNGTVSTLGDRATGLRAVLADYGTRPITGRGEAKVIANQTTVLTQGLDAHGALARDNPASVTMNQTSVHATGETAHGSVAENGGLIAGNDATVLASGTNSSGLYALGELASSTASFTDSVIANVDGPTIGVAGAATVGLANTTVGGSGEWLHVGTMSDFPPLTQLGDPITGIPDPLQAAGNDSRPGASFGSRAVRIYDTPGLATVTASAFSILTGSASTAAGSISNVTLQGRTVWRMTGDSNLTNVVNTASLIAYSLPSGGVFKTLTAVNYTGGDGRIHLNTFLGTDGSPSDLLRIDGGTGSGTTLLEITNAGGPGALTTGNGILVVSAINGATTVPGAFELAAPVKAGVFEYFLFRGSVDASAPESWFLRSTAPPPDLTVTKSHAADFAPGQVGATYTVTVTNLGPLPTSGTVTLADTIPPGLNSPVLSGPGWTCVATTCTRSDSLAVGASYPPITVTVNVSASPPATVTNVATVSGGGDASPANNTASDPTTITALPDLAVTKTHAGTFTRGQVGATYTVVVANVGTSATSGTVTVAETVPLGLTLTGLSGSGWSCLATSCTRSDALTPGASYPPITVTVNVALDAPTDLTNTVTVSGGGETNTQNNTATDPTSIGLPPDLTIRKTRGGPLRQGQLGLQYTVTVVNVGPTATSGLVEVVETLPPEMTLTALSGVGWTCTLTPPRCERSDVLEPGDSYPPIVVTVNVAANTPLSLTNIATVSGGGDVNPLNNTATDTTIVVLTGPDLTVTKSHQGDFTPGQTGATYTVTVTNVGLAPTTGPVLILDVVPSGMTATAISGSGWTCTVTPAACTRSDVLGPGSSYPAITVTVDIGLEATGTLTNVAIVAGGGDVEPGNNEALDPAALGTAIPVLSPAGLLALVGLLLGAGIWLLRGRPLTRRT